MNEQFWWLLARSGGIVALALVAASVVWGLLVSSKYLQGGAKPRNLVSVHRFLGAMSVVFTGIHLAALWLDSWIQFTLADLLIPFAADWRPVPVALGVIGFWLLVAVQGSSLLMRRLPRRLWKWVHLTSFALLPLGLLHGITAGTDAHTVWYRLSTAGAIGLVTWLTVWRAWLVPGRRRRQPGLAPAGAAAARGGHDQRIQPLG